MTDRLELEAREQLKELQELADDLGVLTSSKHWSSFKAVVEKHIAQRKNDLLVKSPRVLESEGTTSERLAGEACGMVLVLNMVDLIINEHGGKSDAVVDETGSDE